MDIIVWLEFEFAYYNSAVQHFNHYTMGTPFWLVVPLLTFTLLLWWICAEILNLFKYTTTLVRSCYIPSCSLSMLWFNFSSLFSSLLRCFNLYFLASGFNLLFPFCSKVSGGFRICWLYLYRRVWPLTKCSGFDCKTSDGGAPLLESWGM